MPYTYRDYPNLGLRRIEETNDDGTHNVRFVNLAEARRPFTPIQEEPPVPAIADIPLTEEFIAHPPAGCSCEYHKMKRMEMHSLKRKNIESYSFKPETGWVPKKVKDDPFNYFFGIELETDNFAQAPNPAYVATAPYWSRVEQFRYNESDLEETFAADMARPRTLWFPKSDSSVSGPEFVSHPATLTYWHSKQKELKDMFQMLLHAGYRSHDNDRCGMHVNISRNAFEGAQHLYRFLTLLHYSPTWSLRMSQRTAESSGHWAPMRGMSAAKTRRDLAEYTFDPANANRPTTDKYSALNMPAATQGRFEFRLPRGTLRLDRFFKNIEWTAAMVEFTRDAGVANCTPKPFMLFVKGEKSTYPNLDKFITERADRLKVGAGRPSKAEFFG